MVKWCMQNLDVGLSREVASRPANARVTSGKNPCTRQTVVTQGRDVQGPGTAVLAPECPRDKWSELVRLTFVVTSLTGLLCLLSFPLDARVTGGKNPCLRQTDCHAGS